MKSIKIFGFAFFLLVASVSIAQEKTGNIVQYFGKEKVEDISEGEVLHIFTEGWMFRNNRFIFNTQAVENDSVLASFIENDKQEIVKQEPGNNSKDNRGWEKIEISEKNEFRDSGLRTGYLYLEYESPAPKTVLFEASGHTTAIINGLPHEGDHYDFGWSLIPVRLKKGKNVFLLSGGRFNNMRARLLDPDKQVQFTTRDLTLPDVLKENKEALKGGIRIINTKNDLLKGAKIVASSGNVSLQTEVPAVSPLNVRKVAFSIPVPANISSIDTLEYELNLIDAKNAILDTQTLKLAVKSKFKHHKRTFISGIDGSVQYYSMAPSLDKESTNQALFLSVHGASVEAVNQANAYKQKDWGHLVAPTNRRPFGFAWEDWGRLDALEVLAHAESILNTSKQHTYLTGHSMGGHGTWYLGATYPDKFAAIAPAAGYPDLLEYRYSFLKNIENQPEEYFHRLNTTKSAFLAKQSLSVNGTSLGAMDAMLRRAGNPSRTLKLINNYLHFGVYVLHGEVDSVVPTFIAREMRERLGKFHNDFVYYEYPGGTHWYGDHSVDWPLIFDFFKAHEIKAPEDIDHLEFSTGSPGVSAGSHFIQILQQEEPFEISSFEFSKSEENKISLHTKNVETLAFDLKKAGLTSADSLTIDKQALVLPSDIKEEIFLKNGKNGWTFGTAPSLSEKGPHRNGGFKDAFRNNMVLVYATKGATEENEWYYNRAKYDAEKFYYRANGNVELIPDTQFKAKDFKDRNVIIYGNRDNNKAWKALLKDSPIQVSNNKMQVGEKELSGDQWGAYFIFPRKDSDFASVGVVTATGKKGMKAAYANNYLENGTFYPDVTIFDDSMMKKGILGVKMSGFFGNSWTVEGGDFEWKQEAGAQDQEAITSEEIKGHIYYLASAEMKGRYPGTKEVKEVVNYISEDFRKNGISPFKDNYLQEFTAQMRRDSSKAKTWNVVGYLEGNDPVLKEEVIILGAHYDHLGMRGDDIYFGADDNASGMAALLEISERLAANKEHLKRTVIFIAFGAEEQGLLGSRYFTENPLVPLENIKLMINIDMLGRLNNEQHVYINGGGTFAGGEELLKKIGKSHDLTLVVHTGSVGGSDHVSFYEKNLSVLGVHTGGHDQYHQPTDVAKLINIDGEKKAADYIYEVLKNIASGKQEMNFVKQD